MKFFLKPFFILLLLTSCSSNDEIVPNEIIKELNLDKEKLNLDKNELNFGRNMSLGEGEESDNGYILSSLVASGQNISFNNNSNSTIYCDPLYTVYATSGRTIVNYDRAVHIGIVKKENNQNNIIEAKIVIIPAGQTHSNNVQVFRNSTKKWGRVKVKIFSITNSNYTVDYTNSFELRNTSMKVNNCYRSSYGSVHPCNPGASFVQGEGGLESENTYDHDNDGLCNDYDPDYHGSNYFF